MFTVLSRIAASVAVAASLIAATTPAHADVPPSTVTCQYKLHEWNGGFTADLFVTNHGPLIERWITRWTFSTPTQIGTVWGGALYQADPHDALGVPASFNSTIRTGQTVLLGWTAFAARTEVPTDLTVNGMPC